MAFYKSGWFKYLKNLLIGVGAAFIIIGALFKIMHWEGANTILVGAMIGEAIIFLIQAIIPPDKDYHWEKYYPGLDSAYGEVEPIGARVSGGSGATAKLDVALAKANVNDDLIGRLGSHLNSLGDNLAQLTKVTNATAATNEYSQQAKNAAKALAKVKASYENAANAADSLAGTFASTKKYNEQVEIASDKLSQLNAVYEIELKDAKNHLKAMNTFYNNLTSAVNNLNDSVEDTKKYKVQMSKLSKNLTSLNTVYGNMLNAMSMGGGKR